MNTYTKTALILILGLAAPVWAATYYIDYDGGLDSNAGTIDAPWKHAPGADGTTLVGGDILQFKAGVVYRGEVKNLQSGTAGNQITYRGEGWGTGKAIVDGSRVISGPWTVCASSSECFGNGNYAHIYTATAPEGTTYMQQTFQNEDMLLLAQDPNPEDVFYYQNHVDFYQIPTNSATKEVALTYITDPDVFSQADSLFWDGGIVMIYKDNNTVSVASITAFDPDTDTVSFSSIGGTIETAGGVWQYSVANNPFLIDTPGEFAIVNGTMYLWAFGGIDPDDSELTMAFEYVGVNINGKDYITVEGFEIRKCFDNKSTNHGCGVKFQLDNGSKADYCIVQDNYIHSLRSWSGGIEGGAIHYVAAGYGLITSNTIENCQQTTGIKATGTSGTITHNYINKTSGQGIYVSGNGNLIAFNEVQDIWGVHSNGISVYGSDAVKVEYALVANNYIHNCAHCFTVEDSRHIYVIGNIIDACDNGGYNFDRWGDGMIGEDDFVINNTIIRNLFSKSITSLPSTVFVANNIIDGGAAASTERRNNIFTGFDSNQDVTDLQPGEIDATTATLTSILLDPDAEDFTPVLNGIAVDACFDISTYTESLSAFFPTFDFSLDINGSERPESVGDWDIGAVEYAAPTPTTPTPIPGSTSREIHIGPGGTFYVWDK